MAKVNKIRIHTKANIKTTAIKAIITKAIKLFIITHAEIFNRVIITANPEAEAMAKAEAIIMAVVMEGPIIKVILTTNTISIMVIMFEYQTDQYGPPCALCGGYNHSPKHCFKGEHDINDIMKKMKSSSHQSQSLVYIPKGEHDNPHELPKQQDLEGSTEIEHTLYSHIDTITPATNSSQKLDYIYQHFQDNEIIHESDPNLVSFEIDNTLYPHINNDIKYGLFEDVIDSYY